MIRVWGLGFKVTLPKKFFLHIFFKKIFLRLNFEVDMV